MQVCRGGKPWAMTREGQTVSKTEAYEVVVVVAVAVA